MYFKELKLIQSLPDGNDIIYKFNSSDSCDKYNKLENKLIELFGDNLICEDVSYIKLNKKKEEKKIDFSNYLEQQGCHPIIFTKLINQFDLYNNYDDKKEDIKPIKDKVIKKDNQDDQDIIPIKPIKKKIIKKDNQDDQDIIPIKEKKAIKIKIPKILRNRVWNDLYKTSDGECVACKQHLTKDNFECAHIQASSKGGETIVSNLTVLCGSCNKSVGTNNLNEFMEKHGM